MHLTNRRFFQGKFFRPLAVSLTAAGTLLPLASSAQTFPIPNNGDLLAGFRKTGINQANYEAVIDIGNVTNLLAMSPGSQVTLSQYTPNPQLVSDSFSDYNNLQWSVSAANTLGGTWAGFPVSTLWLTVPRSDPNIQTPPPSRSSSSSQAPVNSYVAGIGVGADYISAGLGSNQDNTVHFVREPSGDTQHALSVYIADPNDPTRGDFNGLLPFSVENTTPANFSSAVRSDLYQFCPNGRTDPITQLTSGVAYYVGYFQFNPDGTLNFVRASTNSVSAPQILSVNRAGTTSTVSFTTTAGPTYTLFYTNAAGLGAPLSTWPSSPVTVSGDGTAKSLTDTSTDSTRFYRVGAR